MISKAIFKSSSIIARRNKYSFLNLRLGYLNPLILFIFSSPLMLQGYKKEPFYCTCELKQKYQSCDRKLKIVRHTKTNSGSLNSKLSSSRNSLYSNPPPNPNPNANNNEVVVKLILSKVDFSKIQRSFSNPYIAKNLTRASTLEHSKKYSEQHVEVGGKEKTEGEGVKEQFQLGKEEHGEEEQVLSPRKTHRNYQCAPNLNKNKNLVGNKQKVIILSSLNLNPEQDFNSKKILKAKILQKTQKTSSTQPHTRPQPQPQPQPQKRNPTLPSLPIPKPLTSQTAQSPSPLSLIKKLTDPNPQELDLETMLKTDLQILQLYPKIDLQVLVLKIKKEELYRKERSLGKWSNFDYGHLAQFK